MPSSKKQKPSWIGVVKFSAVVALILLGLSLFRPNDRDRLVRAANKGYEIIEPSPEYLRSQASLPELIDWAEKGSPAAQTELAFIYRQGGRGVRVDAARGPPEPFEPVIEPWLDDPFPDYDHEPVFAEN